MPTSENMLGSVWRQRAADLAFVHFQHRRASEVQPRPDVESIGQQIVYNPSTTSTGGIILGMVGRGGTGALDAAVGGALLRVMREAAGLSLADLAAKIPYSKAALGHYETGTRPAPSRVVELYERECGIDPIVGMVTLGRADVDRRGFLRSAVYSAALSATAMLKLPTDVARIADVDSSRRIGMGEVAALRGIVDAFQRLDEWRGGGVGRTAIAEFLSTDIATFLQGRFANDQVRAHAFSAAAEMAYLGGFKAHDAGLDGLAQRYYLRALRLAEASGIGGHDAWVLRVLALQGTDIRQRKYSVALAAEAVARAKKCVGSAAEAVFTSALARCHAEVGENREARNILRSNETRLSGCAPLELPRWCEWWIGDHATIVNQTAKSLRAMGEHRAAADHHEHAASLWDSSVNRRVHALTTADIGLARWKSGDQAGAVEAWRRVVPILLDVQSVRIDTAIANIRARAPELIPVSDV